MVLVALGAVTAVLLASPATPLSELVSPLALMVAGGGASASCWVRAWRSEGHRRRAWELIGTAGLIVVAGNVIGALTAGVEGLSTTVNDTGIAIALVVAIAGLLLFPRRREGFDLATLVLDGLVAGSAGLIIASSLIYEDLLAATSGGLLSGIAVLILPVLDVVIATIAMLLFLRSGRADRQALALIAAGFTAYVISDLTYVVAQADGAYAFGTWTDLGWIAGYALIGLAAWVPAGVDTPAKARGQHTYGDTVGTVAIFTVLFAAGIVQTVAPHDDSFYLGRILLWAVLVSAAVARQLLLAHENNALRRGLEQRVADQTADLQRWAEQTRALLDSVGDGIYGVDTAGRITFLNRSAREMLGLDERIIGTGNAHELFHAPDRDGTPYPISGCYITEAIESAAIARAEEDVYLRQDGSPLAVEITASPLLDGGREVTGAVVAFRDATERREVERMKEEFLSVVSHELRTPLTAIRGSLGLISGGAMGQLDPEVQSLASMALDSSERLSRLVNDILDVERLTSGTFDMHRTPHQPEQILKAAALELASLARGAGITLEVQVVPGTTAVAADADRFAQVMANLVGNAVKFSDAGSVVTLAASPHEDRDDLIVFTVRDEGRGIPPEKLDLVFERFRQVDSSDARREGGTGLGLAITKAIVAQMGGRVWAESTVGEGSTFFFTLPAATHRDEVGHGGSR
ncbi:MAG: ATP-binding protein [Nocardioides sp.]|nr:ATP-binding protein [Nocardioides sp.]